MEFWQQLHTKLQNKQKVYLLTVIENLGRYAKAPTKLRTPHPIYYAQTRLLRALPFSGCDYNRPLLKNFVLFENILTFSQRLLQELTADKAVDIT